MQNKIFKFIMWGLIAVSVIILIWGWLAGFEANDGTAVDVLLRWGYVLLVAAAALAVGLALWVSVANDPKSLMKLGIAVVGVAVVVAIAYFLASGADLVGYIGQAPSKADLKLTDTLLNLAYMLGGGAIVAILVGEVLGVVRNK